MLCPLRTWFRHQKPVIAGITSYAVVVSITLLYSLIGALFDATGQALNWDKVLTNFVLGAVFSGIVLRYFYLQQQLRNQQQAELEARIDALQARIRPHFLFNSMNSIASLIAIDPQAAEKMVVDLSDLFRASLKAPGLIPLAQEVELCQRFSGLEQTRMGDRLQMDWQLKNLSNAEIPSLLLQPLIENAIYHGIEPLMEGGIVKVSVDVIDGKVQIHITNPLPKDTSSKSGHGVALGNIRSRLEAYYGVFGRLEAALDDDQYHIDLVFPARTT